MREARSNPPSQIGLAATVGTSAWRKSSSDNVCQGSQSFGVGGGVTGLPSKLTFPGGLGQPRVDGPGELD